MAIIPFSTPANLSWSNGENQGLGRELAWKMHAEFLTNQAMPIVEVFEREDWPGKKNEFYAGNFGSIAQAREAGYDLVLIGLVEPMRGVNTLTVHTKIIDADAGITIWYGTAKVEMEKSQIDRSQLYLIVAPHIRPDLMYMDEMISKAAGCTFEGISKIEYAKEEDTTPIKARYQAK